MQDNKDRAVFGKKWERAFTSPLRGGRNRGTRFRVGSPTRLALCDEHYAN
jgi:hypothetical protein